jgi:hypothetical protein
LDHGASHTQKISIFTDDGSQLIEAKLLRYT